MTTPMIPSRQLNEPEAIGVTLDVLNEMMTTTLALPNSQLDWVIEQLQMRRDGLEHPHVPRCAWCGQRVLDSDRAADTQGKPLDKPMHQECHDQRSKVHDAYDAAEDEKLERAWYRQSDQEDAHLDAAYEDRYDLGDDY